MDQLAAIARDEDAARTYLESLFWPTGPVCPHCGCVVTYRLTPKPGSPTRKGLLKCKTCRKQFSVTVKTPLADTHLSACQWAVAISCVRSVLPERVSATHLFHLLDVTMHVALKVRDRLYSAYLMELYERANR